MQVVSAPWLVSKSSVRLRTFDSEFETFAALVVQKRDSAFRLFQGLLRGISQALGYKIRQPTVHPVLVF